MRYKWDKTFWSHHWKFSDWDPASNIWAQADTTALRLQCLQSRGDPLVCPSSCSWACCTVSWQPLPCYTGLLGSWNASPGPEVQQARESSVRALRHAAECKDHALWAANRSQGWGEEPVQGSRSTNLARNHPNSSHAPCQMEHLLPWATIFTLVLRLKCPLGKVSMRSLKHPEFLLARNINCFSECSAGYNYIR